MSSCTIVPPYILEALAQSPDPELAAKARESLRLDADRRAEAAERRSMRPGATTRKRPKPKADDGTGPVRLISDAHGEQTTPGDKVRGEGDPATGDPAADEAYDGLGDTWQLYSTAFGRDSIDDKGLPMLGTVHYGQNYDNAFWDGTQMVFGDGDGKIFNRFTSSLDVIGHELTHGVTEHTAGLMYSGQSGALNESVSDVFGSLVKQKALGQSADAADWLIGAELLAKGVRGRALRDMRNPGTAYDDPDLGKDPQPADMAHYVDTDEDNGGVHINSGIPNRAFATAAIAIGGNAWEVAGKVWYAVLTGDGIQADCDFATFADLTVAAAVAAHGDGSAEAGAVRDAWVTVGVLPADRSSGPTTPSKRASTPRRTPSADHRPGPETEVTVRRTGGFAGQTKERHVSLDELPEPDRGSWQSLLAAPTLTELAAEPGHPDSFCYSVECRAVGLHVSVAEPHLPRQIQSLFDRTLRL